MKEIKVYTGTILVYSKPILIMANKRVWYTMNS